jgi:hypothetical protein
MMRRFFRLRQMHYIVKTDFKNKETGEHLHVGDIMEQLALLEIKL